MRLLRLAAAAITAGVLMPTPALAEVPSADIESVTPVPGGFEVHLRGRGLTSNSPFDAATLVAELDGRKVTATLTSQRSSAVQASSDRRVVLVVDTSGSMKGQRMAAAQRACAAYLSAVPEDVRVGIVTFADKPVVAAAPTTDRPAAGHAIGKMVAKGETSLYDATIKGLELVQAADESRLVILSDGEDSARVASLEAAESALRRAGVPADAVLLGSDAGATGVLRRIAAAGGGQVLTSVDDGSASHAFAEAARAFDTRLSVLVSVPQDARSGIAELVLSVATTSGERVATRRNVLLPERPPVAAAPESSSRTLIVALAAVFIGLGLTTAAAIRSLGPRAGNARRMRQVLNSYSIAAEDPATTVPATSAAGTWRDGMLHKADSVAMRRDPEGRRQAELDRAGLRMSPGEWLVLRVAVFSGLLLLLLMVLPPLAVPIAAAGVAQAPRLWLGRKARRRQDAFVTLMPDSLQLVASGLSSGYSLAQALDSVVREGQQPIAHEFGRALAEARVGVPVEDSLDSVAERMDSDDFRWVVMAIRVQREVGGNLSEVLRTVCHTMRERATLRRQVKVLSAEGKLSAVILTLLPILVALFLTIANPGFFAPMYETPVGIGLLCVCAVMLALGGLWMKQLVKVEM